MAKYVNRQIIAIAALGGMTFSLYMIPYCPTELVFFIVGAILGFASGLCDASHIVWIIEIWQERAAPFILAQHLFYAVGSVIPSLLIAPFLSKSTTTEDNSNIYIPFMIMGAITTVALLFQVLLFVFCRYYTPPMYASEISNELSSTTDSSLRGQDSVPLDNSRYILGVNVRRLQLIIVAGFFLGAYQGMEVGSLQFIPIFGQYSDLKMTESASAYVLSGLTGTFAVGRIIGVILILKVRPGVILCINFVLVVIANTILLIWANDNLAMFWIGCILLGIGYSTMFPGFCAFIEKYLIFTNFVGSFVCVTGSIFAATYPLVVGHFIEKDVIILTYTNFFSTLLCILAITWGYLLVRKVKTRV